MRRRSDGLKDADAAPHTSAAPDEAARRLKSRRGVIVYVVTLFLVAMLFTILSYFVQARHTREVTELTEKNVSAMAESANLQEENESLRRDIDGLLAEREELRDSLKSAEEKISRLERELGEKEQELIRLREELSELAGENGDKE
jgi:peptidoglycan hydrolase CwlO-like protein